MLPLLLGLALSSTAHAGDLAPPMWGVGPTFSTILLPGNFPSTLPRLKSGETTEAALLDENGKTLSDDYFSPIRGDAALGVRGLIYANRTWRGALRGQIGFGSNYTSRQITLEVDKSLLNEGRISAFVGGGIGIGGMTFKSEAPDVPEGEEKTEFDAYYKAQTYPLRVHAGGDYRLNKYMVELSLFGQLPIPGNQTLYYDDKDGVSQEAQIGIGFNPLQYVQLGFELSGYWGDFKTREGQGKNGKKGKKGK
jgi:hypothetical protein